MEFEWDPKKSKQNKKKHGVSFSESTEIWQGVSLTVSNIAKSQDGEARSATIVIIKGQLFAAIWTNREKKIRIISVRKSRNGEKEIFWQKTI